MVEDASEKLLEKLIAYTIEYQPMMETDVQEVYITSLNIHDENGVVRLLAHDERRRTHDLDVSVYFQ